MYTHSHPKEPVFNTLVLVSGSWSPTFLCYFVIFIISTPKSPWLTQHVKMGNLIECLVGFSSHISSARSNFWCGTQESLPKVLGDHVRLGVNPKLLNAKWACQPFELFQFIFGGECSSKLGLKWLWVHSQWYWSNQVIVQCLVGKTLLKSIVLGNH